MYAGETVASDKLAYWVWGEDLPAHPRNTLHTYVRRLRDMLGPHLIETVPHGYLLRVGREDVDLLRFRDLVRQARACADAGAVDQESALLRQALSLRRGEPFEGLTSLWLERELAPLVEEEWLAALARQVDLDLAAGRYRDLIPELNRLTAAHPLREEVWEQFIRALYDSGRRAEAVDAYERVRTILREEMDLEPNERLQRLHRLVRGGADMAEEQSSPARRPRQLPSDITRFTGRHAVLAALDDLLPGTDARPEAPAPIVIAVVSGPAGVGKTALAVHWAHRVRQRFPDGQLYVNLRGYGPASPTEPAAVLESFLLALGVPAARIPVGTEARSALLRSTLADRRMLILLDNAHDAAQVRPLLPGSDSLVLITSRGQLRSLAAREGARRVVLDRFEPHESAVLLGDILGVERVAGQPAAVARLAHLCAHLPLALGIAAELAGRRPADSLEAVVQQLRDERRRLETLDTGDDPHGSVQAVFSWSYQALTPAAARLFRLLGLHPSNDISAAAAAALSGVTVPQAQRLLDELAGRHQLSEHLPGRYELHDLLRVYAIVQAEREESTEEHAAAVRRLVRWYLHSAANARGVLLPGRPIPGVKKPEDDVEPIEFDVMDEVLAWYDAERKGLIAAVHQAADQELHTEVWQLADALWVYLDLRQAGDDWISVGQAGLRAARHTEDDHAEALMLKGMGNAHLLLRRHDEALRWYEQALALHRRNHNRAGQAAVLNNMGLVYEDLRRTEESIRHHEEGLAIVRELGDLPALASKLGNLAIAYKSAGRLQDALDTGRQALKINQDTGDRRGEACVLSTLAEIFHEIGDHPTAIDGYQQALRLNREMGNRGDEALNLSNLGRAQRDAGSADQARRTWILALPILNELQSAQAAQVRRWLADLT
ncbi:AfsR/SARP family transcriptional regulator [Nonomuraea endophytica]|uniref:AfsR/SARP family transcriptional regulator n=1 Tax=Nonomuraea endophytica TaxID=714136 RepID=UPI0037CC265A